MTAEELATVVHSSKLYDPSLLLESIAAKSKPGDIRHRGYLDPGRDVAQGGTIIAGELVDVLPGDDSKDTKRWHKRHEIEEGSDGIVLKLDKPYIVNHLRLQLCDSDERSYCYYVEVSVDQVNWLKVVDHSKYPCRSWQNLYFSARAVQFVRIRGTLSTADNKFDLVAIEAFHSEQYPYLDEEGFEVPSHNVATPATSAIVQQLKEDEHDSAPRTVYVQLAKPYVVESLSFVPCHRGESVHNFTVEVSHDFESWKTVSERSDVACRSRQKIEFPRQRVVFIRIVGNRCPDGGHFEPESFECPAEKSGHEHSAGRFEFDNVVGPLASLALEGAPSTSGRCACCLPDVPVCEATKRKTSEEEEAAVASKRPALESKDSEGHS
jgi:BTB/POZ domain-containing protein 9